MIEALSEATKKIAEAAHAHMKDQEALTVEQLQEALIQAIKCGDFQVHIRRTHQSLDLAAKTITVETGVAVDYIPYRRVSELQDEIQRLKDKLSDFDDDPNFDNTCPSCGAEYD